VFRLKFVMSSEVPFTYKDKLLCIHVTINSRNAKVKRIQFNQ